VAESGARQVEFGILGPLVAEVDGAPVPLGGPRQRSVLALLLLNAGQVVPFGRIVDALWSDDPPPAAASTLRGTCARRARSPLVALNRRAAALGCGAMVAFSGTIEAGRGGGAYVVLPADVVAALGGVGRLRVTGTLGGVDFASSTMATGGGAVCLGVHKATRQAAGVNVGDRVDVTVERDDRPREVAVPDDLAAALAADEPAATVFARLSFTHRREYTEWIEGAKKPETRARRVTQTLERLRASAQKR
jgi:hypothetical protein